MEAILFYELATSPNAGVPSFVAGAGRPTSVWERAARAERGHYRRWKGGVDFSRHVYITEHVEQLHGLGRPVCAWGVRTGFWGILGRRRGMGGVFKEEDPAFTIREKE